MRLLKPSTYKPNRSAMVGPSRLRILVIWLLLSGCAGIFGRSQPAGLKHANRVALGLAAAALACDWSQTHSAAAGGWRGTYEANPIMGASPSTAEVGLYMAGVGAAFVAVWHLLPPRLRPALAGGMLAVEAHTVVGNLETTPGLCGVAGGRVRP